MKVSISASWQLYETAAGFKINADILKNSNKTNKPCMVRLVIRKLRNYLKLKPVPAVLCFYFLVSAVF